MAGLLAVVVASAKRGLADIVGQSARHETDRWRNGKVSFGDVQLDGILDKLQRSLELDPANPNLVEDLGRLQAARVAWGVASDPRVREIRQQSLANYSRAVAARPTSGRAYAGVAAMKYSLGEIDREFALSLEQALRRSPWDPEIQLLVIEVGLASWQALSQETRQMLVASIRAQAQWKLANQKPALRAILDRHQRTNLACLLEPAPSDCAASRSDPGG